MDNSVRRWLDNKELFVAELKKGYEWQCYMGNKLTEMGYSVQIPTLLEYRGPEHAVEHANEEDLLVNGNIVEVKSRNLSFTCANDFPYQSLIVDTVDGFNKKTDKPVAYVCVSQKTGQFCALDVKKTLGEWTSRRIFDSVRKIHTTVYECDKGLWGELKEVFEAVIL